MQDIFNKQSSTGNNSSVGSISLKLEGFSSKRENHMIDIRRKKREKTLVKKRQQPSIFRAIDNGQEQAPLSMMDFSHMADHPQKDFLVGKIKEIFDLEASRDDLEEICKNLSSSDM